MSYVEYVVEKKGLGKVPYFVAVKEDGDGWVAGLFPAYMAPNPGEDSDEDVFDLAMPDHTIAAPTRDAALEAIRSWVEENYKDKIHERRTQRIKLNP